jgi:hypothetical protein
MTIMAKIMDSQVLVLHVKFGRVKLHLVVAADVNNSLERNDDTTTGTIQDYVLQVYCFLCSFSPC